VCGVGGVVVGGGGGGGGGISATLAGWLLVPGLGLVLHAVAAVVIFCRFISQWDPSECMSWRDDRLGATAECRDRLLHLMCYLEEAVDCDIVSLSLWGFTSAAACTVASALLLTAALIDARVSRYRGRRKARPTRDAPPGPFGGSSFSGDRPGAVPRKPVFFGGGGGDWGRKDGAGGAGDDYVDDRFDGLLLLDSGDEAETRSLLART
jgi:hypothetical protein